MGSRRTRWLAAALTAGLLAAAAAPTTPARPGIATNPDGDFLDLRVGVSPPRAGTVRAPQGVGLTISSFTGNRLNADSAIPMTSLDIFLRQGFTENGQLFPACPLNPTTISRCSRVSQIGTGSAETERLNPGGEAPTYGAARVRVYNGAPYLGGAPTLILVFAQNGHAIAELDFSVRSQDRGLAINQLLLAGSGPGSGISAFSMSIPDRHERLRVRGKRVTVHLLDAPTTCAGAWTFSETTTSAGRRPLRATDSQTCSRG